MNENCEDGFRGFGRMLGSRNRGVPRLGVMGLALVLLTAGFTLSASAAFHLWNVKEIFTNASGSVQFIEMFDNNAGEVFTNGFTLTANSDGVIKTFTFPSNLTGNTPGHLLIAVNGFSSLPGAVTPDFTFSQGGVSGNFFNPTATNITITFSGSGDQMAVTGAALPRDGVHSLTDANANGFPNPVTNASAGVNSPTNLAMNSGSVNVGAPTVMSAVSQKVHGASGTFGIPLPGVECRAAGANSSHRVVV